MSEGQIDPDLHAVDILVVDPENRTTGIRRALTSEFGTDAVATVATVEAARSRARAVDCLLCAVAPAELERALERLRTVGETPIIAVTDDREDDSIAAGATDVLPADAPPGVVRARVTSTMRAATRDRLDRCRSLLDASSIGLLVSRDRRVQWASDGIDDTLGITPETLTETRLSELVHPADRSDFETIESALAGESNGTRRSISCRLRHADDRYRVHQVVGENRLADPTLDGLVWTIESAHSETAASVDAVADESSAVLLNRLGDPAFELDDAWLLDAANEAGRALLGADAADEYGRSIWELLPPSTVDTWFERLTEARERGDPVSFVVDRPEADGELAVRAYPEQASTLVVARARDRTDTGASRIRLERLGSLLDAVPALAAVIEADRIAMANASAFTYTERETVVGHTVDAVFGADVAESIVSRAGGPVRRVDPIVWHAPDGSVLHLSVVPLEGDEAMVVGRDVTTIRRLLDGIDVVTGAIEDLRDVTRQTEAREVILEAILGTLSIEHAIWYRRSGSHLQPVSHVSNDSPIEPPPLGLDLDRIVDPESDHATRLEVADSIPIDTDLSLVAPLAVPVGDASVILAGNGTAGDGDRRTVAGVDDDGSVDGARTIDGEAPSSHDGRIELDRGVDPTLDSPWDRARSRAASPGLIGRALNALGTLCGTVGSLSLDRLEERDARESLAANRDRIETELDACVGYLDRLDRIGRSIQSTPDRASAESAVCASLAAMNGVGLAVVAQPTDDGLDVRAHDGPAGEFATDLVSARSPVTDAIYQAVETNESHVVDDLTETDDAQSRRSVRRYDLSSAVAVPIVGLTRSRGVLAVFGTSPSRPTAQFVRFVTLAGTLVGFAIDSIDQRAAVLAGDRLELELAVAPDDEVLARAAVAADAAIDVTAVASGDATTVYLTTRGTAGESVAEALRGEPTVRSVAVRATEDTSRIRVTLDRPTLPDELAAFGGRLTAIEPGTDVRVFVTIPSDRSVRELVDHLRAQFPSLELVARRPTGQSRLAGPGEIREVLTDRQREVVRTAYAAGYFEWPRDHSGEEIAEQLDISQPTFARHFRAAERAVFETLFDDG